MTLAAPDFLSGLLTIILLDLVLAGDNAIVIALAARNLPKEMQRRAIVWGTAGAVAVRAAARLSSVRRESSAVMSAGAVTSARTTSPS